MDNKYRFSFEDEGNIWKLTNGEKEFDRFIFDLPFDVLRSINLDDVPEKILLDGNGVSPLVQ